MPGEKPSKRRRDQLQLNSHETQVQTGLSFFLSGERQRANRMCHHPTCGSHTYLKYRTILSIGKYTNNRLNWNVA